MDLPPHIVLYDGVCGLCSRSVKFLVKRDRARVLRYAPLQGETAAALRAQYPQIPEELSTVVLVDDGRVHLRSKAFLYVSRYLTRPWRWGYAFRWFPAFLADLGYRVVAHFRYRIWGKKDACEIPAPEERALFLP
jgi:predicted DCC family thiol-disulfide oxidoreductase YuxK